MLLLDTTFLIDAERQGVPLDDVIKDDDDVAIAAITAAELLAGVKLASRRRHDSRKEYVDEVIKTLPIIAYDLGIAVEHSELLAAVRKAGLPRGAHDLLIAATARATGRKIVSADLGAFVDLPGVETISHR